MYVTNWLKMISYTCLALIVVNMLLSTLQLNPCDVKACINHDKIVNFMISRHAGVHPCHCKPGFLFYYP